MAHFSLYSSPFQMCVLCPNPITTIKCFFYISWLHFRINLVNQLHPMKQCVHLFFWLEQGLQFVGVPNWVVWVFQCVLFHWQNHWTHGPFFYPYFVFIFNGALGWTKIPLLISKIPMISICFCLCQCFWY